MTRSNPQPVDTTDLVATVRQLVGDPAARTYLGIGVTALLVLGAALFTDGYALAAGIPTLLAAAGLVSRHPAVPPAVLGLIGYLIAFRDGIPIAPAMMFDTDYFRLMDMVIAGATVTYLTAHYRLAGLTRRLTPSDAPRGKRPASEPPVLRPSRLADDEEYSRLVLVAGAAAVLGQFAWLWAVGMRVRYTAFPPVRLPSSHTDRSGFGEPLLLLLGLTAVIAVPAVLGFWYWRLSRLGPAEARMVLLDTGWRENRRELARLETWRAWPRNRRFARADHPAPVAPEPPKTHKPWRWVRGAVVTMAIMTGGLVFACLVSVVISRYLAEQQFRGR